MSFTVKLCQKKSGYRIIPENKDFEEVMKDIKDKIDNIEMETPYLFVFHYKGKKISLSKSSLIIRDCSKEEAEEIADELI